PYLHSFPTRRSSDLIDLQYHFFIRQNRIKTFIFKIFNWIFLTCYHYKITSPTAKTFNQSIKIRKKLLLNSWCFQNSTQILFIALDRKNTTSELQSLE